MEATLIRPDAGARRTPISRESGHALITASIALFVGCALGALIALATSHIIHNYLDTLSNIPVQGRAAN